MRIAIFGTGGVGGYYGGRLAQAGEEVIFIARGAQLQALRRQGLRVDSVKGFIYHSLLPQELRARGQLAFAAGEAQPGHGVTPSGGPP